VTGTPAVASDTIQLKATADIWLSDANPRERHSSAGKYSRFKLKTIQEMAAIRFDTSSIRGRKVKSARLFLKLMFKGFQTNRVEF
jgi:hypothetical protein